MASFYNARFHCPDPLNKTAVSRSTRHRITKKRKLASAIEELHESRDSTDGGIIGICNTEIIECMSESSEDGVVDESYQVMEHTADTAEVTDMLVMTEGELLDEYFSQELLDEYPDCNDFQNTSDSDDNSTEAEDIPDIQEDPLFEGCPLTPSASNILLLKMKMRHGLSNEALSDLLKLIKLHCPTPNLCCRSMHFFNKQLMKKLKQPIQLHSFCSSCLAEIESVCDTKCPNQACNNNIIDDSSKSYFIELPLEPQITSIIERKGIFEILFSRYHLRSGSGKYEDIYDGAVYQGLVSAGFLSESCNFSLTFNTDGVPVFKSSSFSVWPLHLVINELPFALRFLKENRLLGGLWYGSCKPDMSLFLKPFSRSLTKLYDEGLLITPPDHVPFICRFVVICCTCDLPAKALVLNSVQYNGFYGCSHCLQKGTTWKVGERGRVHVFPYQAENPTGPTRTDVQTRSYAKDAVHQGLPVMGLKGPSWLGTLPAFDLVRGMSCDYMHAVLLGVCRILLRLWHDSKHHQEIWYLGTQMAQLDARLCSIRPPSEIRRTPRSIANSLKFWKAHELRAWLLHYSPVVLVDYLDGDYYQHHLLLVEAIYLLSKDSICGAELRQSERLLKHYCLLFGPLYGERYLTGSVHGLLHLSEAVKNLGPLWVHSCFGFEGANGDLLKLFHGSQGVEKQMISQVSTYQRLPELAQSFLAAGSLEEKFFMEMSASTTKMKHRSRSLTQAIGKPNSQELTSSEIEAFSQYGVAISSRVLVYKKFTVNGRIVSAQTNRKTLRDNSCFTYSTDLQNQYGLMKKVVFVDGNEYAVIVPMDPAEQQLCCDRITKAHLNSHLTTLKPPLENLAVVSLQRVVDKCVFMDLAAQTGYVYASCFPNSKEYD